MPDQVFDQWLSDVVAQRGWPQEDPESELPSHWQAFFMNRSLSFWKTLVWTKHNRPFEDIEFDSLALEKAALIVRSANTGEQLFRAPIENSAARLDACVDFLEKNHTLPGALVCVVDSGGKWHLVDGHHRVAALIGLLHPDELDEFVVSAWVGSQPPPRAANAA